MNKKGWGLRVELVIILLFVICLKCNLYLLIKLTMLV